MKKSKKSTGKKKNKAKPVRAGKRASQRVLSAATHLKKTTKKMVDDVFLKLVGMKVLARAQEMTQTLKNEGKPRKKAQK